MGTGGTVSMGSSLCSGVGALEVLPWEGLQEVQNSPPTDFICR